jgi:hypothetical protein
MHALTSAGSRAPTVQAMPKQSARRQFARLIVCDAFMRCSMAAGAAHATGDFEIDAKNKRGCCGPYDGSDGEFPAEWMPWK